MFVGLLLSLCVVILWRVVFFWNWVILPIHLTFVVRYVPKEHISLGLANLSCFKLSILC